MLRNRVITVLASTLLMVGTFMLARTLPTGFTPTDDFGFVNLNVSLPPGSTMDDSRRVGEEVQQRLSKYKEVVHVTTNLSPRSAGTFVTLVERKDRELSQQHCSRR